MLASPVAILKGFFILFILAGAVGLTGRLINSRLKKHEGTAATTDERNYIKITRFVWLGGIITLEVLIFAVAIAVIVQ